MWHVFAVHKMTVNTPRFATIPPQIHHQKTTFYYPFLPKPPAKTHESSSEKNKDPTEFYRVFICKLSAVEKRVLTG
jgi:hypothetical protein